jgi:hypothetical protein
LMKVITETLNLSELDEDYYRNIDSERT